MHFCDGLKDTAVATCRPASADDGCVVLHSILRDLLHCLWRVGLAATSPMLVNESRPRESRVRMFCAQPIAGKLGHCNFQWGTKKVCFRTFCSIVDSVTQLWGCHLLCMFNFVLLMFWIWWDQMCCRTCVDNFAHVIANWESFSQRRDLFGCWTCISTFQGNLSWFCSTADHSIDFFKLFIVVPMIFFVMLSSMCASSTRWRCMPTFKLTTSGRWAVAHLIWNRHVSCQKIQTLAKILMPFIGLFWTQADDAKQFQTFQNFLVVSRPQVRNAVETFGPHSELNSLNSFDGQHVAWIINCDLKLSLQLVWLLTAVARVATSAVICFWQVRQFVGFARELHGEALWCH